MRKTILAMACLSAGSLLSTAASAADYEGHSADRGVVLKVERDGYRHYDGDRWRNRGPRVGIVIGDSRRGYGRCKSWRHECADRWGWGGRRFERCLDRHGC
jgi:hypothetical protein